MNNTITISLERYNQLIALEAKVKATEVYCQHTEYPNEEIMAGILGIKKAPKKELEIPKFMEK